MKRYNRLAPLLVVAIVIAMSTGTLADDWLQFRGTDHRGVGTAKNLPATFDDDTNMAWKIALPGAGPSSPIVVGDLVVVTAATGPNEERLHVLAFDKRSGEERWHRQFWATGHTAIHPFGGVAAHTPASDGKHIVAMFSSNDIVCLDLEGNLEWLRGLAYDFPTMRNDVGMSSSPVVVGDVAVVQCENQGASFAAGLDLTDGSTVWSSQRDQEAVWSSPVVMRGESGDRPLVLFSGREGLTGIDPATGRVVFFHEAQCNTIASATTDGRDIYVPANGIHRLRYDPATQTAELLWYEPRLRGSNPSPVVDGDRLYVLKSPSILVAADTETGRVLWQERIEGKQFWAPPVLADGKLYITSHDGLIQAVQTGERGEPLGTSKIEQGCLATPAIDEDAMYIRTNGWLRKVVGK